MCANKTCFISFACIARSTEQGLDILWIRLKQWQNK